MSIKGRLQYLKSAHLALIYAIHGIDEVYKNVKKELLLFSFYFQCMSTSADACIKEKRKKALPDLEVVTIVALVNLLCLIFMFFIDVVIYVIYRYCRCCICFETIALAIFLWLQILLYCKTLVVLLSEWLSPLRAWIYFNLHNRISLQNKIIVVSIGHIFR